MVPKRTRVIEFGAGTRPLERCLDPSCTYVASDLVERGPDTFVCDLNRRPLPDLSRLRPDVAVFAGVLEYVRDVPSVVAWLSGHVRYCVVSYAVARPAGLVRALAAGARRTYYGYMNSYSEAELVAVFRAEWVRLPSDGQLERPAALPVRQAARGGTLMTDGGFIPVAAPALNGNEKAYVLDCLESTWISSSGKYLDRFEAAFAEFCGVRARGRLLERDDRAPPRPRRARHRPGRRGHRAHPDVRGDGQRRDVLRRPPGVRRRRRRRRGPSTRPRSRRRSRPGPRASSSSTCSGIPPTWTRSAPSPAATVCSSSRTRPRRTAPSTGAAGPAPWATSPPSASSATRSSRPARAAW